MRSLRELETRETARKCVCVCVHFSLLHGSVHTQKRRGRNVYYVLQRNWLWTTIPELCGMCPLTASDWNLHSLNNCSTQSVVVYCHSESESSADHNTGTARERERGERPEQCCCLHIGVKTWATNMEMCSKLCASGFSHKHYDAIKY